MKHLTLGITISLLISLFLSLLILPVLSLKFTGIIIIIIIFAVILILFNYITQKNKWRANHLTGIIGGVILFFSIGYLVVAAISSSAIFRAETKQQMLDVEEVVFDESVPNIDMNNLIIWDESDAIRFGEKLITEKDPSLGSMYSISQKYGTLSVVDGKPHWLFPLEHSGFFKYIKIKPFQDT